MLFTNAIRALNSLMYRWGIRLGITIPFSWTGYIKMGNWKYFTDEEVKGLETELVAKLDQARHYAGIPFVLTSTVRSDESNERALGVENSAHLSGKAVDIRVDDSSSRFQIVKGLVMAGFNRIGVYDHHCHADIDGSKPQNVLWTGVSH